MNGFYFRGTVSGGPETFTCHRGGAQAIHFQVKTTEVDPMRAGETLTQVFDCVSVGDQIEAARRLVKQGQPVVGGGVLRLLGASKQLPDSQGINAAAVAREFVIIVTTLTEPLSNDPETTAKDGG